MILTVSRHPQHFALIDAGLFLQALVLAAGRLGLDTCAHTPFLDFSTVLRRELDIEEDHIVIWVTWRSDMATLSTHR
jgi:nitroreductase